jgi:hypothetical protein
MLYLLHIMIFDNCDSTLKYLVTWHRHWLMIPGEDLLSLDRDTVLNLPMFCLQGTTMCCRPCIVNLPYGNLESASFPL